LWGTSRNEEVTRFSKKTTKRNSLKEGVNVLSKGATKSESMVGEDLGQRKVRSGLSLKRGRKQICTSDEKKGPEFPPKVAGDGNNLGGGLKLIV